MEGQQNATLPHEDPVMTSDELEDVRRKLDRELLYLLNKLRSHAPKLKKPPRNATNTTTNTTSQTRTEPPVSRPETEDKNGNEDDKVGGDTETPEQEPKKDTVSGRK